MESTNALEGAAHSLAQRAWPGLLSPECTVPFKPPHVLLTVIEMGLASPDLRQAFAAANLLAHELHRSGERDVAQDVCLRQIECAAVLLRRGGDSQEPEPWVLLLGLQAAVNLIRFHGQNGILRLAQEGLDRLERLADGQATDLFGLHIPMGAVAEDGASGSRTRRFARDSVVTETSKALFRRGLTGQRIVEVRELCAKWPSLRTEGPFHAHELLCLHGLDWPGFEHGSEDVAPALRLIARVRALNGGAVRSAGALAEARALYRRRGERILGAGTARARYLAALGSTLYRLGEPGAGSDCLRDACESAAPVDPDLANGILRRWSMYAGDRAVLPPPVAVKRPDLSQLLKLVTLSANRFDSR